MNSFIEKISLKGKKFSSIVPLAIFAMLLLIMIPVPTMLLDILLLINIAISAVIFLMSLQAKNVLEFSVLPTMLIFTTLTRIVLNVSSSRLILGKADGGKVIDAIGKITIGGDYVVGVIVFIIITIVMFLVINNGTDRIAGVSARFILDSLPGKQMSIDADLNSGVIDIKTAQKKRLDLEKESDFYKSMDGASKFIKGDAIAGLIITFVNIIGGLIMGMTRHGMSIGDAASKYTILSIGDGLVNQLPSLLIASAAAFMVTRGNSKDGVTGDIVIQFLRYKEPLKVISIILGAVGILSVVGILDGIPWVVCFILSAITYGLTKIDVESLIEQDDSEIQSNESEYVIEETVDNTLFVDKIILNVGSNVANAIVQRNSGGRVQLADELKFRIEVLRDKIKNNYGLKIPEIRIVDDEYIPSNSFLVRIANSPLVSLNVKPNCVLASFMGGNTLVDFGEEANIPELGIKGCWISKEDQADAEARGGLIYTIFDFIILYLEDSIENNLDKLVSREEVKLFKEEISTYNSAIIDEINQKQIENSVIQKVIQNLLMEKVSIKNLEFILECICDSYMELNRQNVTIDNITANVRQKIANVLTADMIEDKTLNIITLSDDVNKILLRKVNGDISEEIYEKCNNIYLDIAGVYKKYSNMGMKVVFLSAQELRFDIFRTISDYNIKVPVISYEELPKTCKLNRVSSIELN
ncbi:FHIPEP family type III secretion protein [Clostridium perfringens]